MLNDHQKELISFVQEHTASLPIDRRIRIYRGLADCISVPEISAIFQERARILAEAEQRCRELNLKFNGGAK